MDSDSKEYTNIQVQICMASEAGTTMGESQVSIDCEDDGRIDKMVQGIGKQAVSQVVVNAVIGLLDMYEDGVLKSGDKCPVVTLSTKSWAPRPENLEDN